MLFLLTSLACFANTEDLDPKFHLIPKSSRLIAIIDLSAFRGSGLFDREMREDFERMLNSSDQMQKISKTLGIDQSTFDEFMICGSGQMGEDDRSIVVVKGQFPYDKLSRALAEMGENGELTVLEINDLPVYYSHRSRDASYFALIDDTTVVASPSKKTMEDAIEGLTELREPDAEMMNRLKWRADEPAVAIRLAGVFPEQARRAMASAGPLRQVADKMVGYNFVMTLDQATLMHGRLSMQDATAAQGAVDTFRNLFNLGKLAARQNERPDIVEMLDKLKIQASDSDIHFTVEMPNALFQQISLRNREDRARAQEQGGPTRSGFSGRRRSSNPDEARPDDSSSAPGPAEEPASAEEAEESPSSSAPEPSREGEERSSQSSSAA